MHSMSMSIEKQIYILYLYIKFNNILLKIPIQTLEKQKYLSEKSIPMFFTLLYDNYSNENIDIQYKCFFVVKHKHIFKHNNGIPKVIYNSIVKK